MTLDCFATFAPCLIYRSPGNAPAWDDGCALYYFGMLSDIPDADAPMLMKAIGSGGCGKFRPDPDEIIRLWRKITSPEPQAADQLVSRLYALRDKFGEFVVPHPELPGVMQSGEPRWTDPVLRRLAAARGGWVAFCHEEANSTNAAQLLKLATVIIGGADDAAIQALRLEYAAAHPAPAELSAPDEPPMTQAVGKWEAGQTLKAIEARAPMLTIREMPEPEFAA